MADGRRTLGIRADDDAHRKSLKLAALERGLSLQSMFMAALQDYLSKDCPHSDAPVLPIFSGENAAFHEMLDEILREGTGDDRLGIRKNLEWAVSDIRTRKRASKRKKAG